MLLAIIFCGFIGIQGLMLPSLNDKISNDTRIENGDKVNNYSDANYMVYVAFHGKSGTQFCGATILDPYNVMTAAHCARKKTSATLRIGTLSTGELDGGKEYTSSLLIKHPEYNPKSKSNDICIIIIQEGMDLDKYNAKAVDLPKSHEAISKKKKVEVSGWGQFGDYKTASPVLLTMTVPVIANGICNRYFEYTSFRINAKQMCAGDISGKRKQSRKCLNFGDSGGPAILKNTRTQVGIFSFGKHCGDEGAPGVFTKVAEFINWIQATKYSPVAEIVSDLTADVIPLLGQKQSNDTKISTVSEDDDTLSEN